MLPLEAKLKTMYDTQYGCICVCVDPVLEVPNFVLIEPIWFFVQSGAISGLLGYEDGKVFFNKDGAVGEVTEEILKIHRVLVDESKKPLSFFIETGRFKESTAIDVTGYSLDRLQKTIIASVKALEQQVKRTFTTQ